MTATLQTSWRPERLFGMPAFAAARSLGRGVSLGSGRLSSFGYASNDQVKPAVQPTHNIPVGAPSS